MTTTDPATTGTDFPLSLLPGPTGAGTTRTARTPVPLVGRTVDRPVLEVVIPVYNEEAVLAESVRRVHRHLRDELPFPCRVTVADNASTDRTGEIARTLADELDGVGYLRLEEKGRGRALRAAWSLSDADVVTYLDVDLSTDLAALLPLVAPLLSGHSSLAIGTRLARGARVERGPRRELISRTYNRILRLSLRTRFTDAQCGFKALRRDVAHELIPHVHDQDWFFDTELLVLAERSGLRIHEVPVDWTDDPDSSVDVVATAVADLRGIWRIRRAARQLSDRTTTPLPTTDHHPDHSLESHQAA